MNLIKLSILLTFVLLGSATQAFPGQLMHLKSIKELRMEKIDKQTLDYSCGAASLAILLKYYFGDTLDETIILSDIVLRLNEKEVQNRAKEGFSMLDLKRAAERFGYIADGVKLSPQSVHLLKGPVIILLKMKKENHFVVLKGVSNNRAYISDPIRGNLRLSLDNLFEVWHGEALILGLEGFGIPLDHELRPPQRSYMLPEEATVRAFKSIPLS